MDLGALKLLPFIMKLKTGGDDMILSKIGVPVRGQGASRLFRVWTLFPSLAAADGDMTTSQPGETDQKLICAKDWQIVSAMGRFDVGQAVVVVNGHIIAIEGAEGTDQMLERCCSIAPMGTQGASWSSCKGAQALSGSAN